jgi:hypothetical protein
MKVRILKIKTGEPANASIEGNSTLALPSPPHDEGWRFNFAKLSKQLKHASTYVLVTEETPHIIEGCLIFQLQNGEIPYGAYIEVAPHNKGKKKRYAHVAGCLIAFAFQLSLDLGKGDYAGLLYFDVLEEKKEDEVRLMSNYSSRYGAKRVGDTTKMLIADDDGHALIEKYLGWEQDSAQS